MARKPEIDAFIASINKKMGEDRISVQRGTDITCMDALRLNTGSLGLDIALNGGVPRGMITQFMGEESSGKTTMSLKTAGVLQDVLGDEASIGFIAVEGFDKKWANQCGCAVPFSKSELDRMNAGDRKIYSAVKEIGSFVVGQAHTGEDALQLALDMVRSNKFQLVILDSVAALVPSAEEEKEMVEQTMGQSPRMLSKFTRLIFSAFNSDYEDGRNGTALLLINQVRDKVGTYGHPEPDAPGGRALRHAAAVNVRFKKGQVLSSEEKGEDKYNYGRTTKIRIEKSKVGPPLREATFDFYFQPANGYAPGDVDWIAELRVWGIRSELIQKTSNVTYEFAQKKFKGKAELETFLRENPKVALKLRGDILQALTTTRL